MVDSADFLKLRALSIYTAKYATQATKTANFGIGAIGVLVYEGLTNWPAVFAVNYVLYRNQWLKGVHDGKRALTIHG